MLLFHFETADPKYGPTWHWLQKHLSDLAGRKFREAKKSAFINNFLPVAEKKTNFLSLITGIV